MYSLYKGGPGVLSRKENFGKSRMQEKPSTTFLRLILYIFIFHLSVFFIIFCYSLKFSGYSLYFEPSLFSNQYFFCLLFSNQY